MELQSERPPAFSDHDPRHLPIFPQVPTAPLQALHTSPPSSISPQDAMNIDSLMSPQSRSQRASSVASGMSLEDLQAAETLEFLKNSNNSTRPQAGNPPQWVASQSEYPPDQQEPLLHLLTSQVPLLSSAVNGSMYAYTQTKSYSPVIRYPAEFLERNIGNPVADTIGAVGRRTGVEGGLRWAFQGGNRKRRLTSEDERPSKKEEMDVDRDSLSNEGERRAPQFTEPPPIYDEFGRSPPYQADPEKEEEHQLVLQTHQNQPAPGWQTRLMVSTSGLGVAMSEQSRRNLKYCLSWLRWANDRLAGVIIAVRDVLKDWEEGTDHDGDQQQAAVTARLQALSRDVAETVKRVVAEVSNYAGGALPQNAKELVHRYFNSLPHRWRYASTMADTNAETQNEHETVSNGRRVLALAREGLNMMSQVTVVVNDTLTSAETWCERLGKKNENRQYSLPPPTDVKMEPQSMNLDRKEPSRS